MASSGAGSFEDQLVKAEELTSVDPGTAEALFQGIIAAGTNDPLQMLARHRSASKVCKWNECRDTVQSRALRSSTKQKRRQFTSIAHCSPSKGTLIAQDVAF